MNIQEIKLQQLSTLLYGRPADKVVLYLHGQAGNKEEAAIAAEIFAAKGWQTFAIDLPKHGQRKDEATELLPWEVVPELNMVADYLSEKWQQVALYANSISAWFSLMAFSEKIFTQAFFVSPVLDMKQLIYQMMTWAQVTADELQEKKEIQTDFGQTLSWQYLQYAKEQPVSNWPTPTKILYGEKDHLTPLATVQTFVEHNNSQLTIMPAAEHWFHTPDQMAFLKDWLSKSIEN
ncbi:alpha/beta hydrolase [Enterococcus sp. LJL90]